MMKLIVNADDFGINNDVNQAICYCFENKIIDKTSIMVNMPSCNDAVKLSIGKNFFDKVGLHINLIEGVPLTEDIKQTRFCKDGVFSGNISTNKWMWLFISPKEKKAVCKEINAQMDKYLDYGFNLCHIDSHQHSHIRPSIINIVINLAEKKKMNSIRLALLMPSSKSLFVVRAYKNYINNKIKNFNYKYNNSLFPNIQYADGLAGIEKELNMNKDNNLIEAFVETWIHPTIKENKIVNDFYNGNIDLFELVKLRGF